MEQVTREAWHFQILGHVLPLGAEPSLAPLNYGDNIISLQGSPGRREGQQNSVQCWASSGAVWIRSDYGVND
jgi:hypothetical protein